LQTDIPEIDVWYSKTFDVHVWSDHPKLNQVVDGVFDSLTDEQKSSFSSKSNNAGKASGKTHLKVVLIDLYVAWKTDPLLCIGVARGNDAYRVKSRYNALHISPKVRDVINALRDAEFIDFKGGSNDRSGSGRGSHTSRMRAAARLRELFEPLDIELYELDLHHNQECIILNNHDVDEFGEPIKCKTGKKKSKPIEYKDTKEIKRMRRELTAYNDLLRETYIDIPTLSDPRIKRKKSTGEVQFVAINQSKKFVRRVFSRGKWNLNGRYYGGWWQQIGTKDDKEKTGKDYRRQIYINDNPTVEVDYSGLHIAILSAWKGIQDNSKDRYDLGEQILPKFTLKEQRDIVKLLVLTAINAKDVKSTYQAFRKDQPTGSREKKLKDVELSKLLEAFLVKYPDLRDDLGSDIGIKLMFIDSQITEWIIGTFVDRHIPILSVHDSYIVETNRVDMLREAMSKATIHLVGRDLDVEQDEPRYSDNPRMLIDNRVYPARNSNQPLKLANITPEYKDRLLQFIKYRSDNFQSTYWYWGNLEPAP